MIVLYAGRYNAVGTFRSFWLYMKIEMSRLHERNGIKQLSICFQMAYLVERDLRKYRKVCVDHKCRCSADTFHRINDG